MAADDPDDDGAGPADGGPVSDPLERRRRLVSAIAAARRDGVAVAFEADVDGSGDRTAVVFEDRTLRLTIDETERARLDDVLAEYRAFKVAQPETRTADADAVVLSAVTDAKHAADFMEALFRTVYGAGEGYDLHVRRRES